MNLLYQDNYSQLNRLSKHLGFEDWDSLPDEKRKEVHQFLGLLKEIERDFHNALLIEKEAALERQKRTMEVFETLDFIHSVSLKKEKA